MTSPLSSGYFEGVIERWRRLRQRAGIRWWIFGGLLLILSYYTRHWLAARSAGGRPVPLPWLGILATASIAAAALVILIMIGEGIGHLKKRKKPLPTTMYPCPSCGFLVHAEPAGSYEICGICDWEDEPVGDPRSAGGANRLSLAASQAAILKALPLDIREHMGYRRDPRWRPLSGEGRDENEGP